MQATGTFRGIGIGKRAFALVAALLAAIALGGVGGYVAKSLTNGQAAPQASVLSVVPLSVSEYRALRGGPQSGNSATSQPSAASSADDGCINRHKTC